MRNFLIVFAVCAGLVTVAACKSAPKMEETTASSTTDELSGDTTTTPEPDTTSTDIAMAEPTAPVSEPTPEPPVQSLGSSSSGLGH